MGDCDVWNASVFCRQIREDFFATNVSLIARFYCLLTISSNRGGGGGQQQQYGGGGGGGGGGDMSGLISGIGGMLRWAQDVPSSASSLFYPLPE